MSKIPMAVRAWFGTDDVLIEWTTRTESAELDAPDKHMRVLTPLTSFDNGVLRVFLSEEIITRDIAERGGFQMRAPLPPDALRAIAERDGGVEIRLIGMPEAEH